MIQTFALVKSRNMYLKNSVCITFNILRKIIKMHIGCGYFIRLLKILWLEY
jgi:hypothetical protein